MLGQKVAVWNWVSNNSQKKSETRSLNRFSFKGHFIEIVEEHWTLLVSLVLLDSSWGLQSLL